MKMRPNQKLIKDIVNLELSPSPIGDPLNFQFLDVCILSCKVVDPAQQVLTSLWQEERNLLACFST